MRSLAKEQGTSGAEHYLQGQVAAVSVGKVDGQIICDLDYAHDSRAEVDMNVVKRGEALVEVQGTGEQGVFSRKELNALLDAADIGIDEIMTIQRQSLGI